MKKELMKKLYNSIDNQWLFIMKATEKYNQQFRKKAKIGEPPKIEEVIEETLHDIDEEEKKEENSENSSGESKEKEEEEKEDKKSSGKKKDSS